MTPEVKQRIEQIRQGIVPEGYKKGKIGIVPIKWNEVPFSTLFTSTSEYTDDLKQYPLYSLTIEDGITAKTERYERSHLVKKENSYKVVRPNDYAYNPMNIRFGAVARHKGDIPVAVSGYYDIFTTVHESDLVFMDSFLTYGPMITYYNKVSTGSLVEKQRVHFSDFLEFSLALPPLEERKKIAEILSTQDKAIELQARKIEELKRFKKGCLEKMFPREGQKVPEKRFPGFTDDWEQRKLGEMGQTYTGLSGKTKDDFGHGQARFVTYMNVFSNPISNPEMTEPIEIDPKQNEVEVGDVFFTTSSETPEEVGMSSILLEKRGKTYLNSFCFGFRPSEKIDSYYLAYMLRSESTRAKIILLAQGISRYNISKNKVMEIAVSLPSLDEQKMIGQYFTQLDHLITLHQRKLEEMKKQKKALMQLLLTGIVRVQGNRFCCDFRDDEERNARNAVKGGESYGNESP